MRRFVIAAACPRGATPPPLQTGSAPNIRELAITEKCASHRVEAAELGGLEWFDVILGATQAGPFALEIDDVRLE